MRIGATVHNASASVEELRIIATILLVLYHVVGPIGHGLNISSATPLRLTVDILGDFRMPAFALVAGFVYALRPLTLGTMGAFLSGKVRRLVIPGAIAATRFVIAANLFHTSSALPWSEIWVPLIFPYAHFWFLQSILVLFVVIGIADVLTRQRAEAILFSFALILYFVPLPLPEIFSIDRASSLAPFFVAGICIQRHQSWIARHAQAVTVASLAMVASWAAFVLIDGSLVAGRPVSRHGTALLLTIPLAMILILHAPHHPKVRVLGQFSFTIYLYHIFGTAGARMALQAIGIENLATHIVVGLGAGLALPMLLHLIMARWPLGARAILGLRQQHPPKGIIRGLPSRQDRELRA